MVYRAREQTLSDSITQTCAVWLPANPQQFRSNVSNEEEKKECLHPSGPLNSQRVSSHETCWVASKIDKRLLQT